MLELPGVRPGSPELPPEAVGARENPNGTEPRNRFGDQGHDTGTELLRQDRRGSKEPDKLRETIQGVIGQMLIVPHLETI